MTAKELHELLTADIEAANERGVSQIRVGTIKDWIDSYNHILPENDDQPDDDDQTNGDEYSIEYYKAKIRANEIFTEAKYQHDVESFKAVIAMGQSATKAASLINGGAAVALLAFLQHVFDRQTHAQISTATNALLIFAIGAFLAGSASGVAYLSQCAWAEDRDENAARAKRISVSMVVVSFLLFLIGSIVTAGSFK